MYFPASFLILVYSNDTVEKLTYKKIQYKHKSCRQVFCFFFFTTSHWLMKFLFFFWKFSEECSFIFQWNQAPRVKSFYFKPMNLVSEFFLQNIAEETLGLDHLWKITVLRKCLSACSIHMCNTCYFTYISMSLEQNFCLLVLNNMFIIHRLATCQGNVIC